MREIVPNERIVSTEVFEGLPGGDEKPAISTVTFEEAGGLTTLKTLMQLDSRETRDTIIESGMEGGVAGAPRHLRGARKVARLSGASAFAGPGAARAV